MTRRLYARVTALSFLGVMSWQGCSVYDESLLASAAGRGGGAGNDASAGGADSDAGCKLAKWPEKPASGSTSNVQLPPIRVAVKTFDFGEAYVTPEAGRVNRRSVGYDLDDRCTAPGDVNRCIVPSWMGNAVDLEDSPGGRDNNLGKLIETISDQLPGFGTTAYNATIASGLVSVLFEIRGYNGEPNDEQVDFIVYTPAPLGSFGSVQSGDAGDEADAPAGAVQPKWDGTDTWPVADSSFENGNTAKPKFINTTAYVKDGVVVGSLDNAGLRLSIGITETQIVSLILNFVGAFFTANVVKEEGIWKLKNGQIAGIWKTHDLLRQLNRYPDLNDLSKGLCMDSPFYAKFRNFVCWATDIYSGTPGPSTTCDGVSIGIGFEAVQVRAGQLWTLPELTNRCQDPRFDPANDSCDHEFEDSGLTDSGGNAGSGGAAGSGGDSGSSGDDSGTADVSLSR